MKRTMWKRFGVCLLSAAMAVSMAGCGGEKGTDKNIQDQGPAVIKEIENPEWVYVAEDFDLQFDAAAYDMTILGDHIYSVLYDSTPDGNGISSLVKTSLLDGSKQEILTLGDGGNIGNYCVDKDDNVYVMNYAWNMDEITGEYSSEQSLVKYDKDGSEIFRMPLDEILQKEGLDYINYCMVDGENHLFLINDTKVLLMDSEGKAAGSVEIGTGMDSWMNNALLGDDGKVYLSMYEYNETGVKYKLVSLDFASKSIGKTYDNVPRFDNISASGHGTFFICDEAKLSEYDPVKGETTKICDWLDCNIVGSNVANVASLSDGRILVTEVNWSENSDAFYTLSKKAGSEVAAKIPVVVATMGYDTTLANAAVKFNKSNDKYKIVLKTYVDYNGTWTENTWSDAVTAMNNDITSSNCPDIIDLDGAGINIQKLTQKGVFEDLTPYLEKSTKYKRSDFFESVLGTYEYDGKLVGIPKTFSLETLVGGAELAGKNGWTLDEMMAYAEKHPGKLLLNSNKTGAVYYMLMNSGSRFINRETGECDFNSPEFIKILEFANTFPAEYFYDEEYSEPSMIQNGDLLLAGAYMYDFREVQLYNEMFMQNAAFIGYPTDDGSNGVIMQANGGYGITSKSPDKEGAWEFLEFFLSLGSDTDWSYGFSSIKSVFEEAAEAACVVEYWTDEDGNVILDEDGNPYEMNAGGGVGFGDGWTYTYHTPTKEEVAVIKGLVEGAKPGILFDEQIMTIISEESEGLFAGSKKASDVAAVIQSRAQIYMDENN